MKMLKRVKTVEPGSNFDILSLGTNRRAADLLALLYSPQVQAEIHEDFPVPHSDAQTGEDKNV